MSEESKQTRLTLKGEMITINQHYQITVRVNKEQIPLGIQLLDGKKPYYTSADNLNDLFVKVKIPNWNRSNTQMRKYDEMTRKNVTLKAHVKQYDFVDDDGEKQHGICLTLHSMKQLEA